MDRGSDGTVLVKCFAGCTPAEITAALGMQLKDLFEQSPAHSHSGDVTATYDYCDENGELLFQVVRRPGRRFFQRRPDGDGGWINKLGNTPRVLYRLPEVLQAVASGTPVLVCEGEKDADRGAVEGYVTTCNPLGADAWRSSYNQALTGADVMIVADRDIAGRRHARKVARQLLPIAARVRIMEPVAGKDLSDHLAAGHRIDELSVDYDSEQHTSAALQDAASRDHPGKRAPSSGHAKSASTELVELASAAYRFAVSPDGEPFGVPTSGPPVVFTLRAGKKSLRAELASEYFRRNARAAPQQALADALLVLEGIAHESPPQPLHLRVARQDMELWLDLGDDTGRAIQITPVEWTLHERPPMLFRRTVLTAALPEPAPTGDLDDLWDLLNVDRKDRPLVAAWLVASLIPDIPHPLLGITGEQGTGKTSAMRMLVSVVDPSPVPARKPPKDAEAWVTAAAGSWLVGLDNLSSVPAWLSDSLCRAATGEGDVRRRLYLDSDLVVFAYRRCVILNGIDLGATRGDLAERTLPITLHQITDEERRDERTLWPTWDTRHPRILAGLLDLAVAVLGALPAVELTAKPRMADFAHILAAADAVLATNGLQRYLHKQGAIAADTLDSDPLVRAIRDTFAGSTFTGTSSELLAATTRIDGWQPPQGWPSNARNATTRLTRHAPLMRRIGWRIDNDGGANKACIVRWTVAPPPDDGALTSDTPIDTTDYQARYPGLFRAEGHDEEDDV